MSKQSHLSRFFAGVTSEPTAKFDEKGDPIEEKPKRQKLFSAPRREKAKKNVAELYEQRVPPDEVVQRKLQLDQLFERMRANKQLPLIDTLGPQSHWVTQRGCVDAALMIIGEAPGANEAQTGQPFVGASGQLLDQHLREAGIDPERHIYVTNLVKIRPPGNRDPSYEEINAYLPYIREQIAIVQPRLILCLGRFSSTVLYNGLKLTESLLGDSHPKVEQQHQLKALNMGKLYRATSNSSALYLPEQRACYRTYYAYHPSAVLQDRDGERGFAAKWKTDFAKLAQLLLKPPLHYINEVDFLEDRMDYAFPYTHRDTVYYARSPLDTPDAQRRYLSQQQEGLFEMQIHMVDHFSWRNEFEVEGRTRDGLSTHLTIRAPENFFYVKVKRLFQPHLEQLNKRVSSLVADKATEQHGWARVELVKRRSYSGYHPVPRDYLMVTFSHAAHRYDLKALFEEMWTKPKFFEVSIKPVMRFLLAKNAYYFGWLMMPANNLQQPDARRSTCDLEFIINYADVYGFSPAPGEAGDARYEELAQYRVLSVDMEMLNPAESFPAADQNPIVSICAYTQRYNQGQLLLEELRDSKDSTRVKTTGRSNYDDAVAFCVASVNDIESRPFTADALPNAPNIPTGELPVFRRGIGRKTGRYKKKYTMAIRTWNDYIARFADWVTHVGTLRCSIVYYSQELLSAIQSLKPRPDGLKPADVWSEEQCREWEHAVEYIVKHNDERYTGDIGELETPATEPWLSPEAGRNAEEHARLQEAYDAARRPERRPATEEEEERCFGRIEHRWAMFNKRKRIFCYETEADMLRGFRDYTLQYDPDMLTGYNVENFDLSFYIRRVQLLDVRDAETNKLISLGRVRDREDWVGNKTTKTRAHGERDFSEVHIPGRDVFDLLNIFLNETYGKLDSYMLAFVAQVKLGDTKHDVPYSAIPSLYKNNRERLNDYCLKDAELVLMLMNYLNTVNFLISYSQLVGTIPFGRLNVEGMQAKVFSGVFRRMQKEGLGKIMPDVNIYSVGSEPCGFSDPGGYEGAYVFEPRCGLILLIIWVLDFAGLYPNIMRDFNVGNDVMGPKRMWDKLGIDCEDPKRCTKTKKQYLNPKTGETEYFYILVPRRFFRDQLVGTGFTADQCYESKKLVLNPETGAQEHYYTPKVDVATLSGSLTEGIEGRSVIKKKMANYAPWEEEYKILNSQQECLKIRNNSTYGACGVAAGRLAAKMLSEFVTIEGKRMVQQLAADLKQRYGVEIVGGDTGQTGPPALTPLGQTPCSPSFPTLPSSTRSTSRSSTRRPVSRPASPTRSRGSSTVASGRTPESR